MTTTRTGRTRSAMPVPEIPKQQVKVRWLQPFKPLEWQVDPWRDTSDILLLTGSAGGGKSRLAAEKCHAFAQRYPGATVLVLRKVRATMANSTLLFLQRKVIGKDKEVVHRPSDFRFEYSNGSVLAYGGMKDDDQREYIRSIGQDGSVDMVWMEEATQFTEDDFNEVMARLRGQAAPWRQVILTTNPDAPAHWINTRLIIGQEASVYYSSVHDNYHNPPDYATKVLGRLTGVQADRLVKGLWTQGAGVVFDTWLDQYNPKKHTDGGGNVTESANYIPDGGPVIWSVDDGYTGRMEENTRMFAAKSHPRAFLLCQLRQDGQVAVFDESFAVQRLASDHIDDVIALSKERGYPMPSYVVHDKVAAQLSGMLVERGFEIDYNPMLVDESVKEAREWLAADHNGFRRVIAHPRCFYLRYQMQTYSYDDNGKVLKDHDDGPDALRYLIWSLAYGMGSITVDIVSMKDI